MDTKQIKLTAETLNKLSNLENSITFWSLELGKIALKRREVESRIADLTEFRKAAVIEGAKAAGVNMNDVENLRLDGDTATITYKQDSADGNMKNAIPQGQES